MARVLNTQWFIKALLCKHNTLSRKHFRRKYKRKLVL